MRDHLHTNVTHVLFFAVGTIVLIHVLRLSAAQLADNPRTAGAGKALATFALVD
jgi:hypothetical protein